MANRSEGPYSPSPFERALAKGSEFRVLPRMVLGLRLHGFRRLGSKHKLEVTRHPRLVNLFELFLCNLRNLWILWPWRRTRPRIFAIEFVNESLRQIGCRNYCQNGRQQLTRIERHRDSALPGKLIHCRANLAGNRSDDLFVSLADVFIQTIFLRLTLILQACALLLFGLDGFLSRYRRLHHGLDFGGQRVEAVLNALQFIRASLELSLNRLRRVDVAPNSVLLVAEHGRINQSNPAVRHRCVTCSGRCRRSGRRCWCRPGCNSLRTRLAQNGDGNQHEYGMNQNQSFHNLSCLSLTDFLSTDYTDFAEKDKAERTGVGKWGSSPTVREGSADRQPLVRI